MSKPSKSFDKICHQAGRVRYVTDIHHCDSPCENQQSHFERLVSEYRTRSWTRLSAEHYVEGLRWAEGFGRFTDLLEQVTFPLDLYPRAGSYSDDILVAIGRKRESSKDCAASTPQACLLANALMVPTPAAETIMESIVEQMVVYEVALPVPLERSSSSSTNGPAQYFSTSGSRDPARPWASLQPNFPDAMFPIFLDRKSILGKNIRHEGGEGHDQIGTLRINIGGRDRAFETSAKYPITVDRLLAWIPMNATHFVHVYSNDLDAMFHGFLYFNADNKALAFNEISKTPQQHAIQFRTPSKLQKKDSERLSYRSRPVPPQLAKSTGATRVAFVGPKEQLLMEKDGVINPGDVDIGAYAVFFEDEERNCFFEMSGITEVIGRSMMWRQIHTMSQEEIKELATKEVAARRNNSWVVRLIKQVKLPHRDVPVNFARLKVPGVLDPLVLRSLAEAPRQEVRLTLAARAIVRAAYMQMRRLHWFAIVIEALEMLALLRIVVVLSELERDAYQGWDSYIVVAFLWLVLLLNIGLELLFCKACWTLRFCGNECAIGIAKRLLQFAYCWMIVWAVAIGYQNMHVVRPCLALALARVWFDFLFLLSNLERHRVGQRMLPILYTMYRLKDFVLVTFCILCACASTGYALSSDYLWDMLKKTYNLAFLQEFEDDEVWNLLKVWERSQAWLVVEYMFFAVSSLMLVVGMTNILINVMGNAFDYYSDRSTDLFVKHRARTGLRWLLCCRGWQEISGTHRTEDSELLWICYTGSESQAEDDQLHKSQSLRTVLGDQKNELVTMSKDMKSELDELKKDMYTVKTGLGKISDHLESSSEKKDRNDQVVKKLADLAKRSDGGRGGRSRRTGSSRP